MIVYHGSDVIVEKPQFGFGKKTNDYGQGFYCTDDIELAKEWACKDLSGGFLNIYSLDIAGLNILRLDERNTLEWLALLLRNRTIRYSSPIEKKASDHIINEFLPDIEPFDIIIGHRADDSYFSFARAFLSNTITLEQLSHSLKFGNLGLQIFIKSAEAFERLNFVESEAIDGESYYPRKAARDDEAREKYDKLLETIDSTGVYINDILKKGDNRS